MLRRLALIAPLAVVLGAGIAALVWLRGYAPLRSDCCSNGPGLASLGAIVDAGPFDEDERTTYYPRKTARTFSAYFDLGNVGRLPVRVLGLDEGPPPPLGRFSPLIYSVSLGVGAKGELSVRADTAPPFHPFTLHRHELRPIAVRWRVFCPRHSLTSAELETSRVHIRYRYALVFTRTQELTLPFKVTLRCTGKLPRSTR